MLTICRPGLSSSQTNSVWFDILQGLVRRSYQCHWTLAHKFGQIVTTAAEMQSIRQDEAMFFQFNRPWSQAMNQEHLLGWAKVVKEWQKRWSCKSLKSTAAPEVKVSSATWGVRAWIMTISGYFLATMFVVTLLSYFVSPSI